MKFFNFRLKSSGVVLTDKEMRKKQRQYALFMINTAKKLVWLLIINGCLWVWCSYFLAFVGREQIAESLSGTVCTVIIATILGYVIGKTVENVFRYNNFGGESTYPEDIMNRKDIDNQDQDAPMDTGSTDDVIEQ